MKALEQIKCLKLNAVDWIDKHTAIDTIYLVHSSRKPDDKYPPHYGNILIAIVSEPDDDYREWTGDGASDFHIQEDMIRIGFSFASFMWLTVKSFDAAKSWFDEMIRPALYPETEIKWVNLTEEPEEKQELPEREPAQQERTIENAFIHENDFWAVSFQGKNLSPIKHLDGMIYIAHLILEVSIHVSDLYETAHPKSGERTIMPDEELKQALATGEMNVSNMNLHNLDDNAKADINKNIREQREIIDDPESLESEREEARHKIESIQTTLRREYGKNPLARKETVKQNESVKGDLNKVRKSIRKAIETIQPQSSELANYLTCKIIYGAECRFTGDPTVWTINF